jgi:hypothetical protein
LGSVWDDTLWYHQQERERWSKEREKLRGALKAIDKLAVSHQKGAIGEAQKIARAGLRETEPQ